MINILTKEFDFEITNWYYKTKLWAPNCNYKAIPTRKTGYKVKIVILSPWPLHKRRFQCRSVNKGQFQISFHRNL